MNKTIILSALVCCFQIILVQSLPCNCGLGSGKNICNLASCLPQIIRPQPIPAVELPKPKVVCKTVGLVKPLKPIGDLCSCGQTIIKPATVPKPYCSGCGSGAINKPLGPFGNSVNRLFRNSQSLLGQTTFDSSQGLYDTDQTLLGDGTLISGQVSSNFQQGLSNLERALLNSEQTSSGQGFLTTGRGIIGAGEGVLVNNQGLVAAGEGLLVSDPRIIRTGQGLALSESGSFDVGLMNSLTNGLSSSSSSYNPSALAPADPISQALALSNANTKNFVSDSKLSYGFSKLPVQLKLNKPKIPSVPEENLQRVNGPILELKYTPTSISVDQEAIEDLIEDDVLVDEVASNPGAIRRITMGELGYGVEKGNNGKFISLDVNTNSGLESQLQNSYACNDGFKSGQVIIGEAPVNPQVSLPLKPIPPCTAAEVQQNGFLKDLTLNGDSTFSSFSSQSYNSDSSQSNVLYQKLGIL